MTADVCVFYGEDAAPEAMEPTVGLLESLDLDLDLTAPPVEEHLDELTAGRIPSAITAPINDADAVLFGAARGDGDTYIRILHYLRNEYGGGLPANVRPSRYLEGASSPLAEPSGIDYVVVRETMEGEYFRGGEAEGDLEELTVADVDFGEVTPGELAELGEGTYALRVISERNVRRYTNAICEFARDWFDHRPVTITCATKSNVLPGTDGLFDAVVEETAGEYDFVEFEHLYVDHVGHLQVSDPARFDVIATTNASGDILSDVGAATVGGLGLAPSGSFGGDVAYFEPVHGTAPDIVGEGIINPTATILSAVMMLEFLGFDGAASRLEAAVQAVYDEGGPLTPDQGGSASTTEMADAIAEQL